jgi:hypothetical protein
MRRQEFPERQDHRFKLRRIPGMLNVPTLGGRMPLSLARLFVALIDIRHRASSSLGLLLCQIQPRRRQLQQRGVDCPEVHAADTSRSLGRDRITG